MTPIKISKMERIRMLYCTLSKNKIYIYHAAWEVSKIEPQFALVSTGVLFITGEHTSWASSIVALVWLEKTNIINYLE